MTDQYQQPHRAGQRAHETKPNPNWNQALGPCYDQSARDPNRDRFGYPNAAGINTHTDPPTSGDCPQRLQGGVNDQRRDQFDERSTQLNASRSRTYRSQIDLSGHAHPAESLPTEPQKVSAQLLRPIMESSGFSQRVRSQDDDYCAGQTFAADPRLASLSGAVERKNARPPLRSQQHLDVHALPCENTQCQPSTHTPNPNYDSRGMAGAIRGNNWDLVHEPQEEPDPISQIGETLPPHLLQMINGATAAGADPKPQEHVVLTAPQEAPHQHYPYTEPVTRVVPQYDYSVGRASRGQVPLVVQGTHGGARREGDWDKVAANSSRVMGAGCVFVD